MKYEENTLDFENTLFEKDVDNAIKEIRKKQAQIHKYSEKLTKYIQETRTQCYAEAFELTGILRKYEHCEYLDVDSDKIDKLLDRQKHALSDLDRLMELQVLLNRLKEVSEKL